jgi:hypothetical protein
MAATIRWPAPSNFPKSRGETTGTVVLRANPQPAAAAARHVVRVETPQAMVPGAVLAPQQGISRDAKGNATALVIDKQQVVGRRRENGAGRGRQLGGVRRAETGRALIVQGTDKVPGAAVKPVLVKIGADPMGISRFFIDRPILPGWWRFHHDGGHRVDPDAAGGAISRCGAPTINMSPIRRLGETLENSVTQVIEQQLTGIDNLLYFSSTSSSGHRDHGGVRQGHRSRYGAGAGAEQGAAGGVAAALAGAAARGAVTKSNADFLMIVALYDATGRQDSADISDYLVSHFNDPLGRVNGVGQVQVFGSQYAMRVWLDPAKMAAVKLMPSDVTSAITRRMSRFRPARWARCRR